VSSSGMLQQGEPTRSDTAKENGRQAAATTPTPPQPPATPTKTGFR
jgi:hypothetical protein